MRIYKSFISLILIVTLFFTVSFTTACPSESAVKKAAKSSNQLADLTLNAVRTTKTAYESKLITLEQKDKIAEKLLTLSKGGQVFNTAVLQVKNIYQSGNLPPDQIEALSKLFDSSVITPFLAILQDIGAIKNASGILASIELIRTAVLTISKVFTGKTSLILQKGMVRNYG